MNMTELTDLLYQKYGIYHKLKILNTECWTTSLITPNSRGYIQVKYNGERGYLHRLAYFALHPEDAMDLDILHSCDTPACINPAHLRSGTHADNMRDKVEHNRCASMPGCANPNSKLTEEEVQRIRKSKLGAIKLGRIFNVSPATISRVKNMQTYTLI